MEIKIGECPLGAKCETVSVENGNPIIVRCPWYVEIRGVDNNTGKDTENWGCAIAWMPALMINTANEARKGAAATESFRNEVAKRQAMLTNIRHDLLEKSELCE